MPIARRSPDIDPEIALQAGIEATAHEAWRPLLDPEGFDIEDRPAGAEPLANSVRPGFDDQ